MSRSPVSLSAADWSRSAVIYQIYPRSFRDGNGDGIGDLRGIIHGLPELARLDIDAVWLSPFYPSPQNDGGYDVADYCDVDPVFGTLEDFDELIHLAHALGIRVLIDIVPNHTSSAHPWFQEAITAPPGSPARARYIFRDGTGPDASSPPNNWRSVFGGPAWTRITERDGAPGQWYLHLFDRSQPDLDWRNPWVKEQFLRIIRFWLARGVDGFRIDVAHGLIKDPTLPDHTPTGTDSLQAAPYWGQVEVHEIFRSWRTLLDDEAPGAILCGEAWVAPLEVLADWVRPDELHQTFNFEYLHTPWSAEAIRDVISGSLEAFHSVGAPSTWVLSNHDVIRHATRLALPDGTDVFGVSPDTPEVDRVTGAARARAATALMLALPGSAYLYQGEELGLAEITDIPDQLRQDPTFYRTGGARLGRDGCRVPLPWDAAEPNMGFGGAPWLPLPAEWAQYCRADQDQRPDSTLAFYRRALSTRRARNLGAGNLAWQVMDPDTVAFTNGDVIVLANIGTTPVPLPKGALILASGPLEHGEVPPDTTVWVDTVTT